MNKIVRIHQKDLKKMIETNLREEGFLSDSPAFNGASYRDAPQTQSEPVKADPQLKIFLTAKEISFLEDILMEVNPDSEDEKNMLFKINHMLRDSLVNT